MVIFELAIDTGHTRDIFWLGSTSIVGNDKEEADNIYEQLTAREAFFCD